MGVPSNVGAWEVGMGQEAALAIERRAVTVEALSKEDHDVGLLLVALTDVGIGYLSEAQWRGTLPHSECLPDGLECGILTQDSILIFKFHGNSDQGKIKVYYIDKKHRLGSRLVSLQPRCSLM